MQARLESYVEERLCNIVKKDMFIESIKLNLQGNKGWPDRIFLLPLRPAYIEFKRKDEKPYPLQRFRRQHLMLLQYDYLWTDDYEHAYNWLKELLASRLSEAGHTLDDWTSMRRTVVRSWLRENKYLSRS